MFTMQAQDIGRILGIMAAIGLVVFIVVQIASFATNRGNEDSETEVASVESASIDYASPTTRFTFTRDGKIINREDHRQVKITITEKNRIFELIRGYDGQVLNRKVFSNSAASYENFVGAIDYYGFDRAQEGLYESEIGVCPRGQRVILEVYDGREEIFRRWAASCKKSFGTLAGNTRQIRLLFQKQIPDYKQLVRGVKF